MTKFDKENEKLKSIGVDVEVKNPHEGETPDEIHVFDYEELITNEDE